MDFIANYGNSDSEDDADPRSASGVSIKRPLDNQSDRPLKKPPTHPITARLLGHQTISFPNNTLIVLLYHLDYLLHLLISKLPTNIKMNQLCITTELEVSLMKEAIGLHLYTYHVGLPRF